MVVFPPHNLLRDPPFSRLDLVSCRNFLIYLEPDAQQRIIALCHFALREGGHLFLGNAATIGRHEDLFETVSKKLRIYRRLGPTRHDLIEYPSPRGQSDPRTIESLSPLAREPIASAAEMARRLCRNHSADGSASPAGSGQRFNRPDRQRGVPRTVRCVQGRTQRAPHLWRWSLPASATSISQFSISTWPERNPFLLPISSAGVAFPSPLPRDPGQRV